MTGDRVEAAAKALPDSELAQKLRDAAEQFLYDGDTDRPLPGYHEVLDLADSVAAAPLLERQLRDKIADEIDAYAEGHPGATALEFSFPKGVYNGFKRAARMARRRDFEAGAGRG